MKRVRIPGKLYVIRGRSCKKNNKDEKTILMNAHQCIDGLHIQAKQEGIIIAARLAHPAPAHAVPKPKHRLRSAHRFSSHESRCTERSRCYNGYWPSSWQGPLVHPAEWRVKELLMDHHTRSKMQGVPHSTSLEQLKHEILSSPELIKALRIIRL